MDQHNASRCMGFDIQHDWLNVWSFLNRRNQVKMDFIAFLASSPERTHLTCLLTLHILPFYFMLTEPCVCSPDQHYCVPLLVRSQHHRTLVTLCNRAWACENGLSHRWYLTCLSAGFLTPYFRSCGTVLGHVITLAVEVRHTNCKNRTMIRPEEYLEAWKTDLTCGPATCFMHDYCQLGKEIRGSHMVTPSMHLGRRSDAVSTIKSKERCFWVQQIA